MADFPFSPSYVELRLVIIRGLQLSSAPPTIRTPQTVAPAAGTLALSGDAPAVDINQTVVTPHVELSLQSTAAYGLGLEGHAPTTVVGEIQGTSKEPGDGALALDGYAPLARVAFSLVTPVGAMSIDSEVPSLERSYVIVPEAVPLALDGKQPSAEQLYVREVGARSLSFSGLAPSLKPSVIRRPDAGAVALSGDAPSLERSYNIEIASGALAAEGHAPNAFLSVNNVSLPPEGALTLADGSLSILQEDGFDIELEDGTGLLVTEHAVAATQALFRAPTTKTLDLGGEQPTVLNDATIEVPGQELRLASSQSYGLGLKGYPPVIAAAQTAIRAFPLAGQLAIEGSSVARVRGFSYDIPVDRAQLTFDEKTPERATGLDLRGHAPTSDVQQGGNKVRFPAAAAAALSPKAVTRLQTGPVNATIEVPSRQYFLAGKQFPLQIVDLLDSASFVMETYPPTSFVTSPTFFPARAELTFDTKLPFLSPIVSVEAAADGTLTGQAPAIAVSDNEAAAPAAGALTLDPYAILFFPNPVVSPAAGGLTASGNTPNLGRSITPPAISRRLRGKIPTRTDFGVDFPVSPGRRRLNFQRAEYLIFIGFNKLIEEETFELDGKQPQVFLETDSLKIPSATSLLLSGTQPAAGSSRVFLPGAASLELEGQRPVARARRSRRDSARKRFIRLTVRRALELLYR